MPGPYEEMGFNLALYIGNAGATAATQITGATDVDFDLAPTKAPTTNRGTGGNVPIETENTVALKPTITWKQHENQDDSTLNTLKTARIAGLPIAIKLATLGGKTLIDGDFTIAGKYSAPLSGEGIWEFTATATKQSGRGVTLG